VKLGTATAGLSVLALFFGWGWIALIPVFSEGGSILGFTQLTFLYYLTCLYFCLLMLGISRPARKRALYMGFFLLGAILVMISGLDAHTAPVEPSDPNTLNSNGFRMLQMGFAQLTIYVAPGALAALYAYLAYTGRSAKSPSADSLK
jgi:hypothetical protein